MTTCRCFLEMIVVGLLVVTLATCAEPIPSPHPPVAMCPPDPPAGSGFFCAPKPKPSFCTTIPTTILRLNDGVIARWVMSDEARSGIRNAVHSIQDFCGVPETVRLR